MEFMVFRSFNLAAGLTALMLGFAAAPGMAATLTSLGTASDVDASLSLETPGAAWTSTPAVQTRNVAGQYISPFTGTSDFGADYYSLQRNQTATLEGLGNALSVLWGTIDGTATRNLLTFYLNGVLVETVSGQDVIDAGLRNGAATLVEISGFTFDRVVFSASQNAYEFANVSVAPVPLPASGVLLLAAFGGAAAWRRRATRA